MPGSPGLASLLGRALPGCQPKAPGLSAGEILEQRQALGDIREGRDLCRNGLG